MLFALSDEQEQVVGLAREFAREVILPGAAQRDKTHAYPADIIKQMGEMGFMGMLIPEEWGGAAQGYVTYCMALSEICYADASVGVIMSVNNSLACYPILTYGTPIQKEKYLSDLASGAKLGCYALTEPHCGSDAAALRTRAIRQPDGNWLLNGSKAWITNGPQADVAVVYTTKDTALKYKGICAFIVEAASPGFKVGKVEEKMGIRASGTSELIFEDCVVPHENMLGEEGKGFNIAMGTLDGGRIGIASQALGIARRAFDLALDYSQQRQAFGKPLSHQQAIQWMIADMATRIDAARLLILRAAALRDAGRPCSRECAMAKVFSSETANFCADKALQIHGGYGFSQEYEVERLYRDARITTLYEGTSEIQRIVISRSYMG